MPSPDYYLKSEDSSFLQVYEKYARDVAVMFGADEDIAQRDVRDIVELEIKLANVSIGGGRGGGGR